MEEQTHQESGQVEATPVAPVQTEEKPAVEQPAVESATEPAVPAAPAASETPTTVPTGVAEAHTSAGELPAELRGWNWGAFLLTWIWGLGNRSYITLLALGAFILGLIPLVGVVFWAAVLGLAIWFGIKGNEWAWKNHHFESVEQFKKVQKAWAIWGLVVFIVSIILSVVMFSTLIAFILKTGQSSSSSSTTTQSTTLSQ